MQEGKCVYCRLQAGQDRRGTLSRKAGATPAALSLWVESSRLFSRQGSSHIECDMRRSALCLLRLLGGLSS